IGMVGVLHTSYDSTVMELNAVFNRELG
ncbi:MAG: hypothetical protein RL745_1017, partial [Actinomycetota bacterium]